MFLDLRSATQISAAGLIAALASCGGTVVFEEDGGRGIGDGDGDGDGGAGNAAVTTGQTSASSTTGTTGPTTTSGVSTSVTSTNVSASAIASTGTGPACPFTDDGVCDEPEVCPPGTDVADCAAPTTLCGAECAGDPGCDVVPPNPGPACRSCVEGASADLAECAVSALLGPPCQDDSECANYVNCVLGGGVTCESDFPEGAAVAASVLYASCGSCGGAPPPG